MSTHVRSSMHSVQTVCRLHWSMLMSLVDADAEVKYELVRNSYFIAIKGELNGKILLFRGGGGGGCFFIWYIFWRSFTNIWVFCVYFFHPAVTFSFALFEFSFYLFSMIFFSINFLFSFKCLYATIFSFDAGSFQLIFFLLKIFMSLLSIIFDIL